MYYHMASCIGEKGEGVTHESHVSLPPLSSQVGINSVEIEKKGNEEKMEKRKRKRKEENK